MGEVAAIVGTAIALATIAYFLWDRYRPSPHKVDIDTKNTLFARFGDPLYKSGNWGIVFYSMTIVNKSKSPFTVRSLLLNYEVNGEKATVDSTVIRTGSVYSPLDKGSVDCAIVQSAGSNIVLMRWNNIRGEIGLHKTIEPGGVLSGSAYFLLRFSDRSKLRKLNQVELQLVDFSGKKSKTLLKIQPDWLSEGRDAVILNREFTQDKDGKFIFARESAHPKV